MTKSSFSVASGLELDPDSLLATLMGADPTVIGGEAENPAAIRYRSVARQAQNYTTINLLIATGDGGSAPGTFEGAEFRGVVEFETGADVDGTLTGLVTVGMTVAGGGGGAAGASGRMKGWLKKVSKSIRSLESRFKSPNSKFVNSGEVPFGILQSNGSMRKLKKLTRGKQAGRQRFWQKQRKFTQDLIRRAFSITSSFHFL